MTQPVPSPATASSGRYPVVILLCVASSMAWLVWKSQDAAELSASPFASWLALRSDALQPHALVLHVLFHQNGFHLSCCLLVWLLAGRVLEIRLGSWVFLGFIICVSVGSALVGVLTHGFILDEAESIVWIYGGGATAVGILSVLALSDNHERSNGERSLRGWIQLRHALWAGMLLGATGLLLLDREAMRADGASDRSFLLSQVGGSLFGVLFYRILPIVDRRRAAWSGRRDELREENLRAVRDRVNSLLDKINRQGLESLSREEQAFLKKASKYYRKSV